LETPTEEDSLLDKQSVIPLYHQLVQRIRSEIGSGSVKPGDLLGTEKEIRPRYRVSHATVWKALDKLAREGRVVRITGKGTFVSTPPMPIELPHLLSFTEDMNKRGVVPSASLLAFGWVNCPEDDASYYMSGGSLANWFDVIIHSQTRRTKTSNPTATTNTSPPLRPA